MNSDPTLDTVTTDVIETRLSELETVVARVRAEQIALLREVDVRQVPMVDGCRNLSEWMVSRIDVSPETAAALSRLVGTPSEAIDTALASGEITLDRAVELTRLDSADPIAEAEGYAIPRLRSHIAMRRRMTRRDEREKHSERFLMMQPSLDQSSLRLWGELAGLDAARFEQAIVGAADQIPAFPSGRREPRKARMADALVNLVTDHAGEHAPAPSALVSVLVDATDAAPTNGETGAVTLSGLRVGPDALEAILCDGICEVNARTSDGRYLAVGHRNHSLSPRTRRVVHQRDGGMCTADGCTSRYRLQPHHIKPRADLGPDDPANLTLLCWFHHHVVIHRHGFRIDPDSESGRIRFLPPEPAPDPPI